MLRFSALQFMLSLIRHTKKISPVKRLFIVGAGAVIYFSFYVNKKPPKTRPVIPKAEDLPSRVQSTINPDYVREGISVTEPIVSAG